MPTAYINKIAKDTGESLDYLEKKWEEAKELANKQVNHESAGYFAYVTKIFNNLINYHDNKTFNEAYRKSFKHFIKNLTENNENTDSLEFTKLQFIDANTKLIKLLDNISALADKVKEDKVLNSEQWVKDVESFKEKVQDVINKAKTE